MRKLIHFSMGFFALLLKFLSPLEAMICAVAAFLHNLYIFPFYGRRKIEKDFEKEKRYSAIVSYPAVVFFIILFSYLTNFKDIKMAMAVAASSWAVLSFGDSVAGFLGKILGGPRLLWNKEKTWAGSISFFIFSGLFSYPFFNYTLEKKIFDSDAKLLMLTLLCAFCCAVVESLSGQYDDNISFPFVAFSIFSLYSCFDFKGMKQSLFVFNLDNNLNAIFLFTLVSINFGFALVAYLKKWVDLKGFLFGLFLGFVVILSRGIKGYIVLILFFLIANFSTFYRKKLKEERGIEEENKGRRGIESVFSKGLAPMVFSFFSFEAFALCLSFYASDTVATEFGKTSQGKTFSLIELKEVAPGISGAVTLKGTFYGILSIFVFNLISLFDYNSRQINIKFFLISVVLVAMFFFIESIINDINKRIRVTSKVLIHIVLGFLLCAFSSAISCFAGSGS
ncbi:MAG: DUF92 domain-containing protein [Acidobacteriota bacterium]